MTRFVTVLTLVLVLGVAAVAADSHSPRQYYGTVHEHATQNYFYRAYYYKPSGNFSGYKHHYAIFYPSRSKHIYFYNPYTRTFWGRCPVNTGGKPQYSLLAEKDRQGRLEDIPESAFPEPGALPPIPESTDGATLELPPDDLPPDDKTPEK